MTLDSNTTTQNPTHFPAAVPLILEARGTYGICSENWAYPTDMRFGSPKDQYYAEVWTDGMDWQNNYWVIETAQLSTPIALPFIVFTDHKSRSSFNEYDFKQMVTALLCFRRNDLWLHNGDAGRFTDTVWPYLHRASSKEEEAWDRAKELVLFQYGHGSQKTVMFYLNWMFVPEGLRVWAPPSREVRFNEPSAQGLPQG
jgi:hypothetical protein